MPPPTRQRINSTCENLAWIVTDDGSRTLFDATTDETYHSGCGAVAETLIVYLHNSGVAAKLRARKPVSVLEYGLGTATGFLLTAALAEYHRAPLVYQAFEYRLLPCEIIRALDIQLAVRACIERGQARTSTCDPGFSIAEFAVLPELFESLCGHWSQIADLQREQSLQWQLSEFVQLDLIVADARDTQTMQSCAQRNGLVDAVYFDPFSPEANPGLWTLPVLEFASSRLAVGGVLTSYCVKSSVRKLLEEIGLEVDRVVGPIGGKREVLVATRKMGRMSRPVGLG